MITKNDVKWYKSFRTKLYIMLVFISVIPLLIFGSHFRRSLRAEVEDSIHRQHSLIANKATNSVNELVRNLQYSIRSTTLINLDVLENGQASEREEVLYGLFRTFPYLEELKLISSNGQEVTKISKRIAISEAELKSTRDSAEFSSLANGKDYIGNPRMDYENNIVFDLGIPMIRNDEEFCGGIIAKISLRQVMKEISSIQLPEGAYIMLVDEEGALFGHSDFSQVLRGESVLKSKGVEEVVKLKNLNIITSMNEFTTISYESYTGEEVLGVYGLIPSLNWGVVVEQPLAISHYKLNNAIKNFNIAICSILLGIVTVGTLFINKFIQPIDALSQGVDQVNLGNYEYKIPHKSDDEFGTVVDAFNNMIVEIKKKGESEKLVIQAEKRAAIGILAAGVAHEINNPMNNLGFYASDLLDRLEGEELEELKNQGVIKDYLREISVQIERCTSITQSLLNFSRESEMSIRKLNINNIIDDTLKLLEHRTKRQNIKIVKDYFGDYNVCGESSQIQQIFLNLFTNAIDAMSDGGELNIHLDLIGGEEEIFTQITIRDTGEGIPEDKMSKIFDPFFTTKPIGKGTGLGLSISQEIIERLRGRIEINSELNKGTEVVIKLPTCMEVVNDGFI